MTKRLSCFKAYDVRGKLGESLNEEVAYHIGRAFAQHLNAKEVVLGADIRLSSDALKHALSQGLMDAGANVIDIGQTGTEEVYFATKFLDVDGGIEVTASHNPIDYNGMKFVGRGATPISSDDGLKDIQRLAEAQAYHSPSKKGTLRQANLLSDYVDHLLTYIDLSQIKPCKLVVNAGNGAAGHVIDAIEARFQAQDIPIEFIKIHHAPDGTFPNGIPNPILPENRSATAKAVQQHGANMGIAWDGDFDRCFLFDEKGLFIEGYYIVGLLAESFLSKHPGEKIIHDPRLTWNTIDIVQSAGGVPIQSKTGHAFIKARMRKENAIYGGEMSAHHYFRDFAYCDSGMIPWLLITALCSQKGQSLSEVVSARIKAYPCSGELNYRVEHITPVIERIQTHFIPSAIDIDSTDGLSLSFDDWRFNIRASNTEPLLRLNVEARHNEQLIQEKVSEIESLIHRKE